MGENHELKNRYMLVNAPSEWSDETGTGQVQDKYRTSTGQVRDKLHTDNPNITQIVQVVGEKGLSVKEMTDSVCQIVHFYVWYSMSCKRVFTWSTTRCNISNILQLTPHPRTRYLKRHLLIMGRM